MALESNVPELPIDVEAEDDVPPSELEAVKLTARTKKIREIIGDSRAKILGRYLGNPTTIEINPLGQYAINHFDKTDEVATHIRVSRSGDLIAQTATQGKITNNVLVTVNVDDLLGRFEKR